MNTLRSEETSSSLVVRDGIPYTRQQDGSLVSATPGECAAEIERLRASIPAPRFTVSYDYNKPAGAGPFKGRTEVSRRYAPGEHIAAPFGAATVRSCREVRS